MKGMRELVTDNELQIASMLTKSRSDVFLESRGYIRRSLANLFNSSPLDIPLEANPSKPPKLPKGMGNISLSHCHDALIIIWHSEKVGIDIERSDRNFQYKDLAKKYCFNSYQLNQSNTNLKKDILNQWSAIEAAIKLDKGSLAKDLKEWKYHHNKTTLIHKKKQFQVYMSQFNFLKWTISIAYDDKKHLTYRAIICDNSEIL